MITTINLKDFDCYQQEYHKLRLRLLDHQPSGVKANERDLNLFSRFFHENDHQQITGVSILGALTWFREERDNHAGAINRKESSLRSYLKYLKFNQVSGTAGFPIENLPRAREPYSGPIEALEPEEVTRLLNSIDKNSVLGVRDFLLYTLLYRLGIRIGEAIAIDLKDIDHEKEILLIHGKGRKKRKLPLLPDLVELIDSWLCCRNRLYNADQLDALFVSKKGNRLSIRTAQDNMKKLVEKAEPFSIDQVTPHSLRHAFATHAIEGEQDMVVLKAIMGHASSKSTELYVHPSMRVLRKAVNNHISAEILDELVRGDQIAYRIHQRPN